MCIRDRVDNMYGQFIHDVAVGRHTTDDKIAPLATGQVWTGEQAQPLGLIDAQGGYRVAPVSYTHLCASISPSGSACSPVQTCPVASGSILSSVVWRPSATS